MTGRHRRTSACIRAGVRVSDGLLDHDAGTQLYVHGGKNNFVLDDLWVLNLIRKEWSEIAVGSQSPHPARQMHIMDMSSDQLYIFGGSDDLGGMSDRLYRMKLPYGNTASVQRCGSTEHAAAVSCHRVMASVSAVLQL